MKRVSKKEDGIVLLSCLIFLLMLLALLQFTMSSARMEEMKAGADFDQMTAREAANLVMQDAENAIRRVNSTGISLEDATVTEHGKIIELAIDYWADDSHLNPAGGVFDGDTIGCKPSESIKGSCAGIDWETVCSSSNTSKDNAACYGAITGSKAIKPSQGKYVIERFMGNGTVLGMGAAEDKTVILRVTGIGYGQETSGSDRNVVTDTNVSRVMLQNTYILSGTR